MLDEEQLKYDILEEDSAVFRDEQGELVCVAMRDLCSDPKMVRWADSVVLKNVEIEKNIRVSEARLWVYFD